MRYVCFTGHRQLCKEELEILKSQLEEGIERHLKNGVKKFYTAEAGDFDKFVIHILNKHKEKFDGIEIIALHSMSKTKRTKADKFIKLKNFADEFKSIIICAEELICYVQKSGMLSN